MVENHFQNYDYTFANNFHTAFLAWPLYDPHGSVQSGLLSMSKYKMTSAIRRKYPITSAFISKFTDLDRCFVIMRFPINNGKYLVMINSHMSAYNKGGKMRKAQMKLISNVMEKEYLAGNYVIVGGDFNHVKATNRDKIATVRSTDMKYNPKINYMTICDGFIVSKNVKAKATNINTDYRYADHNPVRLEFSLK